MYLQSKKTSLVILGATAIILFRVMFWFFNDPEGPNLLIVMVTAVALYFLSLVAYMFNFMDLNKKFLLAVFIQIVLVTGLYLFLN